MTSPDAADRVAAESWFLHRGLPAVLTRRARWRGLWPRSAAASHLASVGRLVARALPVVLLTVLVFFNGYVWSMATTISRERMWLVIGFLVVIAAVFLLTGLADRVRPMLASTTARETDDERLEGTPFAAMPDPVSSDPLRRGERANVLFVVAASQITQVAMVALVTFAIFFTLGLLALSPDLLADWTRNGSGEGRGWG